MQTTAIVIELGCLIKVCIRERELDRENYIKRVRYLLL